MADAVEIGLLLSSDFPFAAILALHRMGTELTAIELLQAMHLRNIATRSMGKFFSEYDILLSPTLPALPPVIGCYNEGQEHLYGREWMTRVFAHSPFTALADVTGSPAMSVPLGFDLDCGLPIGIQFAAGFAMKACYFAWRVNSNARCPGPRADLRFGQESYNTR